jgi:RimJ/RimL family protein N-acetyltransferase
MDPKQYRVRPFGERDYEALSRLHTISSPEFPSTPGEERYWDQSLAAPHLLNEKWIVEERGTGTVVAVATLNHSPFAYDPNKFWVGVIVDPDHRRRGIGRALSDLLESEAVAHHAACFWAVVRKDDTRSLEFARKQGFEEARTTWMSLLDLSEVSVPPPSDRVTALEREGIRITTLAEEGPARSEVRQRIFELLTEAARDVPRMGDYTPISYEQFVRELEGPGTMPEAYFLARYGEAYVGLSNLDRDLSQGDSLIVGFTATRAAYRNRGIASELKRKAIEFAHRQGIRYLRTFNDSLNQPIWTVNERMGFRRKVEWSDLERRFVPKEATSLPPTIR